MAKPFRNYSKFILVFALLSTALSFVPALIAQSGGRGDPQPVSPLKAFAASIISPSVPQLTSAMDIPAGSVVFANSGLSGSDSRAFGVFTTPPASMSFFPREGTTFVIMSTGLAASADDPDTNNSELVGTGAVNDDVSFALDGINNSQIPGNDLARMSLELDPPAGATSLSFDFAFYSEEFPDWIDKEFNDAFIAEIGPAPFSSQMTIVGNEVNAPTNFALDPNGDVISVNAAFGFNPAIPNPDTDTTYDGTSGLLTATACVPPNLGANNLILILSITDLGDSILDSAVFLDNFRWEANPNCEGGVEPVLEGSIHVTKCNRDRPS